MLNVGESNCVEANQGLHSAGGCHGILALSIAFRIVNNLRMQAVSATLAGLPAARALVERLDRGIAPTGGDGGHVRHRPNSGPTAEEHPAPPALAGIAIERTGPDQCADLAPIQGTQFGQDGQERRRRHRADAGHAATTGVSSQPVASRTIRRGARARSQSVSSANPASSRKTRSRSRAGQVARPDRPWRRRSRPSTRTGEGTALPRWPRLGRGGVPQPARLAVDPVPPGIRHRARRGPPQRHRVLRHGMFLIATLHDAGSGPGNCPSFRFTQPIGPTWRFGLSHGFLASQRGIALPRPPKLYQTSNIQGLG